MSKRYDMISGKLDRKGRSINELQNYIIFFSLKTWKIWNVRRLKWRYSNLWSMLWGNKAYCAKLSGEDLSRYSNKIESFGLRKCPCDHCLIWRQWCHNNKHFPRRLYAVLPHNIEIVMRPQVTVILLTYLLFNYLITYFRLWYSRICAEKGR